MFRRRLRSLSESLSEAVARPMARMAGTLVVPTTALLQQLLDEYGLKHKIDPDGDLTVRWEKCSIYFFHYGEKREVLQARLYLNRRDMRRQMHLVRQIRGRKFLSGAEGVHYDLNEIFERLNARYFNGLLGRPLLGWSRQPSRSMLGHFDPSHNAIIISRIFDSASVPLLALEYVLFHEMLHLRYPVDHRGVRRRVHTKEFRAAERQFPSVKKAKEILKAL